MVKTIMSNPELGLQEQMIALIRAFGLHRPDQIPCGKPVAVAAAHALMELAQGAPLSQNDLAARLQIEKSTVSRLVGILERRGWIARGRSAEDGRASCASPTPDGRWLPSLQKPGAPNSHACLMPFLKQSVQVYWIRCRR